RAAEGREALRELALGPADHAVEVGDRVGVANAGDEERPLGDLARSLELDPRAGAPHERLPCDARGLRVDLLIAALRHVEVAAGHVFAERSEPLVNRVAGERGRVAARAWSG